MIDVRIGISSFVSRLERHGRLNATEASALSQAVGSAKSFGKSECLVRQGDETNSLSILCQGLAFAHKTLSDGRQQNLAISAPGDVLDCSGYLAGFVDVSICALTSITVAQIPYSVLDALIERHPGIGRALWRDMVATDAIAREWMVGMGRRSALENVAHRLCELFLRLQAVDLASEDTCDFPFTQIELADTLGLSVVHVNRVLQQLKRSGLIKLDRGKLIVRDWEGLSRAGDFDPSYLELTPTAAQSSYSRQTSSSGQVDYRR